VLKRFARQLSPYGKREAVDVRAIVQLTYHIVLKTTLFVKGIHDPENCLLKVAA
jgi:hypothetical protein